ncbi:hypothetical protein A8V43_11875 [Escherichia coli]
MDKNFILDIAVSTTDPRNNKEFLWISYSMNNLSPAKCERAYWMTLEKDVFLYLWKTDMIFRQEHGSVLFQPIYIAGKDWRFPHGNLQIHL